VDGPRSQIVAKDIYNARQRLRATELAGRTPIQALLDEFQADSFHCQCKTDDAGHVTHLFFAAESSIELFQAYPEVILMDCTYNSNRFKMPLLTVVGITGISTTFYLAFSFIQSEKEEDFVWVLQNLALQLPVYPKVVVTDRDLALMKAIDRVFPLASHILCQWHINKCVKARAVTHFAGRGGADHSLTSDTVAPVEGEDLVAGFFQE
jgi:histone-lysine N-methyltransferase SETD2